MYRFKNRFVVALAVTVLSIGLTAQTVGNVKADDITWINASQLYLTKVRDITNTEIPSTVWGNVDCTQEASGLCSVQSWYGSAGNGKVKFTSDSQYYPVADYGNSYNHFIPIPNSSAALTTAIPSVRGIYVFFYDDFPGSVDQVFNSLGGLDHYKINHLYDSKLADKSGSSQNIDPGSMGFSSNSDWMIATRPGVAVLRANVSTHEVLPFGSGGGSILSYDGGLVPSYKQAITDDGRFAVVAFGRDSNFAIYDLSTCGAVPNTINGPVSCDYRRLDNNNFISSNIPGYTGTSYIRFIDNNTIDLYVSYLDSGTTKYAEYTLSTTN